MDTIAPRLLAELMPVSIVLAGDAAAPLAQALRDAGADAELLAPGQTPAPADLAILLAPPDSIGASATAARIRALSEASDRILFVPDVSEPVAPGLDTLNAWFELFAELGYQPVVDFDASFVRPGAFLLDRGATAAETELSALAEKLSLGGALAASEQRVASLEAALADDTEARELRAALAAAETEAATLRTRTETAEAEAAAARDAATAAEARQAEEAAGWSALADWVRAAATAPALDTPAAIRAGLAALGLPAPPAPRPTWRARWRRRPPPDPAIEPLARLLATIRRSPLFDAAWYVASNPDLAANPAAPDPALHYLAIGAPAGRDPGPWFDTQAYRTRHPDLGDANPLAHAHATGEADALDPKKNRPHTLA